MLSFKKITQAVLLVMVPMLALSGCSLTGNKIGTGNKSIDFPSEPITLEIWRMWDDSSILDQNIATYKDKHSNVDVVVRKVEIGPTETIYDYQSRIIKLIADGKGPDIFEIHNDWLPYQINQLVPMPSTIMTTEDYIKIYPQVVADDFVKDGKVYAAPSYMDNLILFYNPDLLSAAKIKTPPKTWQELAAMVPKLTTLNGKTATKSAIALGADGQHIPRFADIIATLMIQNGASMTDSNREKATFDLPLLSNPTVFPGAEALSFYTSFANPKTSFYNYTPQFDSNNKPILGDVESFIQGKTAMMIGYSYQIANIKKFNPRFYFETAPLPQANLESPKTMANYWGMAVSRNSKYKEVAWDFVNFMQSYKEQRTYTRQAQRVSARLDLKENYSGHALYGSVAEQLEYSVSWYRKNTPQIENIFAQMVNAVLKGIDANTAVRTAIQEMNGLSTQSVSTSTNQP